MRADNSQKNNFTDRLSHHTGNSAPAPAPYAYAAKERALRSIANGKGMLSGCIAFPLLLEPVMAGGKENVPRQDLAPHWGIFSPPLLMI
jgi:hypothetical protein